MSNCVASIDAQELPCPTEKLILDNGSTIRVVAPPGWRVKRLQENGGNIFGQNMCMAYATTPWVLFVSNDVRLHPGCIKDLWELTTEVPHAVQISPVILWPDGSVQACGGRIQWPLYGMNLLHYSLYPDYIPSICYLARKDFMGTFDTDLPGAYEDVDMGLWLTKYRGKGCMQVCPTALATHLGNATLRYTAKDKWRFNKARRMVVEKRFNGADRASRLLGLGVASFVTSRFSGK